MAQLDTDALALALASSFERFAASSPGGYFRRWPKDRASVDLDDFGLVEFASAVLWEATMAGKSVQDVIRAAEERLQTARFGLQDMSKPERAQSGLYNAVVFGRMVTFALQNLRNIAPDFDEWYAPKQEEMRSDPLMRYFWDLRTQIEKQVGRHTATSAHIRSFGSADMQRFQPAPPGARGFFIGDQNGGSGWEIARADGSTDKYYIDLPPDIGTVTLHLAQAPEQHRGTPAPILVAQYLDRVEQLIREAKARFAP
jgi:hypothetical protein